MPSRHVVWNTYSWTEFGSTPEGRSFWSICPNNFRSTATSTSCRASSGRPRGESEAGVCPHVEPCIGNNHIMDRGPNTFTKRAPTGGSDQIHPRCAKHGTTIESTTAHPHKVLVFQSTAVQEHWCEHPAPPRLNNNGIIMYWYTYCYILAYV